MYITPEIVSLLGNTFMGVGALVFSGCAIWSFFEYKTFVGVIAFSVLAVICMIGLILFNRIGKTKSSPK